MSLSFWDQLEQVTHDAFMASTFFLMVLTLALLSIAIWRLVPQRMVERSADLLYDARKHVPASGTAYKTYQVAEPHRAPTWQEGLAYYLPVRWRTTSALRWVNRSPLLLILGVACVLSARLSNTALLDEAVVINAGRDYFSHWSEGTPIEPFGATFSGAPMAYPLVAGGLDVLGGLRLVRLSSLVSMITAASLIYATVRDLHSRRAGMFAAGCFALSGPVIFLSAQATTDALCICLLAAAAWCGLTRREGVRADAAVGLLLAAAVVLKYLAIVFAPPVLALIVVLRPRSASRSLIPTAVFAGSLGGAYLLKGDAIIHGLTLAASDRAILSSSGGSVVAEWLVLDIGVVLLLAAFGGLVLAKRRRSVMVTAILLAGSAAMPLVQTRVGEGALSFEKHTAYSALFLAPLAGVALARLSMTMFRVVPTLPVLLTLVAFGFTRSEAMYGAWVNIDPVVEAIEVDPRPGLYLSSSADPLKYHLQQHGSEITWETTSSLYAGGAQATESAVDSGRYERIILRTASTGSPEQDAQQAVLTNALRLSPLYELEQPLRVAADSADRWLIFSRR